MNKSHDPDDAKVSQRQNRKISRTDSKVSTSKKSIKIVRHGGPGASHEDSTMLPKVEKPEPDSNHRDHSRVSGGGGQSQ
jgi:hypothetical protein